MRAMGWLATLCCMSAGVCWVTCGQGAKPAKLGRQVVVREGRGRRVSRRGGCFRHCVRELAPSAPYATTAGAQSHVTDDVERDVCVLREENDRRSSLYAPGHGYRGTQFCSKGV